ncbi:hypothetical protein G6F65_017861 [Rhizopus arrhizus]|nr:hypothetical protein G6F65_017861 [Rhizopus arrhizus]
MEDDALDLCGLVRDDRCAAHFGPRTRRGWDRDHGRHAGHVYARIVVAAILEVPQRPLLARHQRNRLGCVQRRAATESDDAVMPALLVRRHAIFDIAARRVALDLVEEAALQACLAAGAHGVAHHRQCGKAGIRDKQGPPHTEFGAPIGKLLDAAGARLDGGGKVPVDAWHSHDSIPEGVGSAAAKMKRFGLRERFVANDRQGHAAPRVLDTRPGERGVQAVSSSCVKHAAVRQ